MGLGPIEKPDLLALCGRGRRRHVRASRASVVRLAQFALGVALISAAAACQAAPRSSSDATANSHSTALAERWLETTSEHQARVLADLRVSDGEYLQALDDTATCLHDRGIQTGPVRDVPDGVRKNFLVIPGDRTEADADAAWQACWAERLDAIESVFLGQHARPDVDEATLERELLACLAALGVQDTPTGMRDVELFQLLQSQDASIEAWVCREHWLLARGELGPTPPK